MGGMADFLELELLDHSLGVGAYAMPGSLYIALYTVTPTDAGGGTEVAGGIGYARLEINGATGRAFAAAAAGATSNSADWSFPAATGDWGTLVAFSIMDALVAGNMLYWGAITPNREVLNGDTFTFPSGELDITLD